MNDFLKGYKTYDTSAGYGSRQQWQKDYRRRMDFDEAKKIFEDVPQTPNEILGITSMFYTEAVVDEAFRKKAFETHPDHGGNHEAFIKVRAAYEILKRAFGRKM